ncbi:MAG: tRNA (adenosine(37)-N6)-threonylcarbamoyltransferase complex ATPase subunit type 1 TsaE [Nitrospinota bacterium]|nr:tRNA (adenosine(37)-N6)-threonylcarbamoyltransferase complex ATPase subunit type 1 TsaE [Nitrospinota bacterium]
MTISWPTRDGSTTRLKRVLSSVETTLALAEAIGSILKPGDMVLLIGELGAGKTTFTQGLCKGIGMAPGSWARSPTFTLINEYRAKSPIRHADLYRIDSPEDFESIGLFDTAFDGITIIEWADKLPLDLELGVTLVVELKEISQTAREIALECGTELGSALTQCITTQYDISG